MKSTAPGSNSMYSGNEIPLYFKCSVLLWHCGWSISTCKLGCLSDRFLHAFGVYVGEIDRQIDDPTNHSSEKSIYAIAVSGRISADHQYEIICNSEKRLFLVTLNESQSHLLRTVPIASVFKWDFSYNCAAVDKISTDTERRAVPLRLPSMLLSDVIIMQ